MRQNDFDFPCSQAFRGYESELRGEHLPSTAIIINGHEIRDYRDLWKLEEPAPKKHVIFTPPKPQVIHIPAQKRKTKTQRDGISLD